MNFANVVEGFTCCSYKSLRMMIVAFRVWWATKWNMGFLSMGIRVRYFAKKCCLQQPFPIYKLRTLMPSTMVLEGERLRLWIHPWTKFRTNVVFPTENNYGDHPIPLEIQSGPTIFTTHLLFLYSQIEMQLHVPTTLPESLIG